MSSTDAKTSLPLSGLRVLDLSRVLAGPLSTMVLSDLGADVLKVEAPGAGDETRSWGPPFVHDESAYFLAINRGKRDVRLDLKADSDHRVATRLITEWADVVVENFRPGALAHLGLDPPELMARAPHLIWATVRGYPPGDDRAGYDFVVQAGAGLMSITGPEAGPPSKVGVAVADMLAGLYLSTGILAAVVRRQREGRGGSITVSLAETQVASLINVAQSTLATGESPRRYGNAHPQLAPYEVYQAQDGPLAVGVGNDHQFRQLAHAVGLPGLADDPRFRDNRGRVEHRIELSEALNRALGAGTVAQWCRTLADVGVPADAVRSVPEVLAMAERWGQIGEVQHVRIGPLPQIRSPIWVDGQRLPLTTPPPVLDQDGAMVRRQWERDAKE